MGSPATKLAANPELADADRDWTRDVERSVDRRYPIDPTPVAASSVPPRGRVTTLSVPTYLLLCMYVSCVIVLRPVVFFIITNIYQTRVIIINSLQTLHELALSVVTLLQLTDSVRFCPVQCMIFML